MDHRLDRAAVIALLSCLAACEQPAEDPALQPRLSSLQDEVFTGSCALASCHSTSMLSGELVLEAGMSHEELVGVPSVQTAALDEGLARVTPGDPEASFLWIKLQPDLDARYGVLMPQGSTAGLDADKLDVIRTWIENGALDD